MANDKLIEASRKKSTSWFGFGLLVASIITIVWHT
jgi:hypothetical protein